MDNLLKLTGGKDRSPVLRRVAMLRNTTPAQFGRRCRAAERLADPTERAAAMKRLWDDLDLMKRYVWLRFEEDAFKYANEQF